MDNYPDIYPKFRNMWNALDDLIENSRLFIPNEVFLECLEESSNIKSWINQRNNKIVYESESLYNLMRKIEKENSSLSNKSLLTTNVYQSDPHIIALANEKKKNGDVTIIITEKSDDRYQKLLSL